MKHLDLFSGIGGFALAASWVWGDEHEIHSFVEIDRFCQRWLKANFLGAPIHDDAKTYKHDGTTIDLLTGGPPCQPVSVAGKRKGDSDDRWQWPAMFRIIQDVKPKWIIFENVSGLINFNQGILFDGILSDMEAEGYETSTFVLPACSQNAPHRRDRVFVVGHTKICGMESNWAQRQLLEKSGENRTDRTGSMLNGKHGAQKGHVADSQSKQGSSHNNREKQRKVGESKQGEFGGSCLRCGCSSLADTKSDRFRKNFCQCDGEPLHKNRSEKFKIGNWNDSQWITGHDGKARRVPISPFRELVDGVSTDYDIPLLERNFPKRADFLRGFGNAICVPVVIPIMEAIKSL